MIVGKIWGSTSVLIGTPFVEVHRLRIEPNANCSMHKHEKKWNGFFVISGRLTIEVAKNDYPLTDRTDLGPGEFTTVRPGEFHRFVSHHEPVEALEIYYPEALAEDIVRKDCGTRNVAAPTEKNDGIAV